MLETRPDSAAAPPRFRSLVELLHTRAVEQPDQLAYQFLADGRDEGSRFTYAELDRQARAIASLLQPVAQPGDRALLMYAPGVEFLPAFFGCLYAGVIAIPLPPPDTARMKRALPRLAAVVQDAQASLALTTSDIHAALEVHLEDTSEFRSLRWLDTDQTKGAGPDFQNDSESAADKLELSTSSQHFSPAPGDVAFLQYTSGSTSAPKGVIVSHENVLSQCRWLAAASDYSAHSVTATWMPYFHDYGLIEGLLLPLFVGIPCYFMSPVSFIKRPIRWLEAIGRYRVTHSQAPNFAYDLCVHKIAPSERSSLDLSGWRSAANGAESVRPETLRAFYNAFKDCGLRWQSLAPAYGLAEATLVVSATPSGSGPVLFDADTEASERGRITAARTGHASRTISGSGRVLNETRVEIIHPVTRLRCTPDEVGEIWVAGPSVTQGYWKREQETTQTFQARLADTGEGPFLRTGDLGCLLDGELFVTGRLKDLIIIRGLNHYPQDIELTVERSHPALRPGNGAAFSVEVHGEEELVVVQEVQGKQRGPLNAEEVLSAIRAAVFDEHELRLHAIVLLKSGGVLKTTSGKIQRRAVKSAFLAGELDAVARWQMTPTDQPQETDPTDQSHRSDESHPSHQPAVVRDWIANWLANKSGTSPARIDTSRAFADFGLDSLRAVDLANDLASWLKRPVEPIVFWNHPTIDALADQLAGHAARVPVSEQPRTPSASTTNDGIAIVGLGCRFPGGADSPEAFWNLIERVGDAIGEIPRDRWDVEAYYDADPAAPGKMYSRHGGFVREVDRFDAAFFRITPREAAELDPQQRLLLEVAWESLELAGVAPSSLQGSDTGVFIGLSSDDHATWSHHGDDLSDINAHQTLGAARSIAAGRIAYVLGLHGPVVQLDTACSSSLVAVYQACQSLLAGECELALAGGVNLMLSPATTIALCKLTALAADGRTKPFDAAADGYVRGEGCGLVVLKRMSDAVRDGDTILARIRVAVLNHDGASNGLTAPNGAAQEQLIRKALRKAGVEGRDVTYVEAHGTGTPLGDPIELEALNRVYGAGRSSDTPLYVGSAKSNIGHLEAAAGIAGLIKVVLMLRHGRIAPQLHFHTPNPHLDWNRMPIRVATESLPWPDSDQRRLAAVSSFGFSGTNAHVIVEEVAQSSRTRSVSEGDRSTKLGNHPRSDRSPSLTLRVGETTPSASPPLHLLPLSARSDEALQSLARKYVEHLAAHPEQRLEDICFSAATTRDHFACRLAVVAASRGELLDKLRAYVSGDDPSQVVCGGQRANGQEADPKIAFLFTGQGSQYVGMGRELYESHPVFRAAIDRCGRRLGDQLDVPLTDVLFGEPTESRSQSRQSLGVSGDANPISGEIGYQTALLDQTQYTQPALFALQYALAELWKSWGIEPAAVLGHSAGEFAAACVAGVFSLETGLELVATRGRLIQALPQTGEMAVVMAGESRVAAAIGPLHERVSIAAINGPDTIVISGERGAVRQVVAELRADGVDAETLNTSNAGHSTLMRPMLEPFGLAAARFSYSPPKLPMISNVSGRLADGEMTRGEYWVRHVQSPVRFADGMHSLLATGCRTFVEIGPNPNLLAMGMGCVKDRKVRSCWLPSLTKARSGWETMLYSLAELYVRGADVNWRGVHEPFACSRVSLPTYAFQRQTYRRENPSLPVSSSPRLPVSPSPLLSSLPSPDAIAARVEHLRSGLEDESRALTSRLDEISVRYVINALRELGFVWQVGAMISDAELDRRVPARHRPKVSRVLSRLVERGFLESAERAYRVRLPMPDRSADELLRELEQEQSLPECDLLGRAGAALAAIWRGDVEPLTFLFPDGSTDKAAQFYSEARMLAGYNRLAGEVLQQIVNGLPVGESLRILEVGAGTGGLTMHLLPQLPVERSAYVFTDVSPLFLRAAEERFRKFPFLEAELLDIGRPPAEQGFDSTLGSFDLVVAANVLHATPRLQTTLTHVRQLLKPNGWLLLLEGANPPLWGDMIFTLIDGWWSFEDKELRPDYPLMRRDRWQRVLSESGFPAVACLNDARMGDDSNHTLYLAQADGTFPERRTSPTGRMGPGRANGLPVELPVDPAAAVGEEHDTELEDLVRCHAARVMRLSPEVIDSNQPLSELGLDSLMAVELRTQLSRALGTDVSLNLLRMRRSVAEIVAYLRNPDAPSAFSEASRTKLSNLELDVPRVHLVPLQPNGRATPLFFVPAGYGDLLAFQDVAHALGADQPVYGLQPASAKQVKTIRQMSIYRLVSAYISEIKKVQPTGPYQLSGYSAGAIIAIELARELLRQGDEVSLLVIFDPPSHVPFWLDWFYAINYRICLHTRLLDLIRGVRSRFVRRLFHTMLDEGLRTHTTVTTEHRVAPYPGRITHFRARLSQSSLVSLKPVGRFWRRIALDGVEVHWIPGTHYGMLRGPGAGVVVDELYDCLQRAGYGAHSRKEPS